MRRKVPALLKLVNKLLHRAYSCPLGETGFLQIKCLVEINPRRSCIPPRGQRHSCLCLAKGSPPLNEMWLQGSQHSSCLRH